MGQTNAKVALTIVPDQGYAGGEGAENQMDSAMAGAKTVELEPVLARDPEDAEAMIDKSSETSKSGRLLLVGLALVGVVGMFLVLPQEFVIPITVALLVLLAVIGVFFLFAAAIGFVHVSSATRSEDFARAFLDGLTRGALVTDHDGRIVYANRSYGDLTGADSPRSVATIDRVFSFSDDASEIVYQMNRQVRDGETVHREFRVPHGIGNAAMPDNLSDPHWYRLSVRPMKQSGRAKPLIVWEVTDVTHDRARQEGIFQDLQHAIDYLDHAPAGFFSAAGNGEIVYLNATLADWLGIDLAAFRPGSLRMEDLVQGDGIALLDSLSLKPQERRTAVIDLDLVRSNGHSLPVRLYHKVPLAADGAPGATRTLVLNRSAGEGISEQLRAAEVRFARFFNNTPIAIASVGEGGEIIQSNAPFQKLFAKVIRDEKREGDLHLTDLCSEGDRGQLAEVLSAANAGKGIVNHVDSHMPGVGDQSIRFFLSAVSDGRIEEGDGPHETAVLYAIDTTEQKALERQMAQGQKMQAVGQLAGGIAHDFNNVLTAIIGFSDLLLANHRPSDPSFRDIMNIKQNANRAASLVRQLLAFSRRQTLRPQTLSIADVLADLRMLLARLVGDKIKLEIRHGRDLWPVRADIGQFEQVIVNLCVNAKDAIVEKNAKGEGGDAGTITISTQNLTGDDIARNHARKEMPETDYVMISVTDTGTGIAQELLQQIFEPFFSTKDVGKGTGLGLATVYGIVKQSGGFVYPVSTVGEGTTFALYFPRYEPSQAEIEAANAPTGGKEEARNLAGNATIVFVEDEDAVRAVGVRTLQARGYTVHEAENGVEALELLEELGDAVDLVVSDVVMPEMDGPTLYQTAREKGFDVRFIFASGYAEDAFDKSLPAEKREEFGFLPKPYSLKQLATAVKEVVDGG